MTIHSIKILPENYQAVASGNKPWELRKNDRNYQRNDKLVLNEFDGKNYTGKQITAYVSHIFFGGKYGLSKNYCILSIRIINIFNPDK